MTTIQGEVRNRVLTLTLDEPGKSVNVLNSSVMAELAEWIAKAESDDSVAAVLIRSAKPANFIAGADIKELDAAADKAHMLTMIRKGQALFNRLDHLKKPVIAAIRGSCLGGGMELALACDYRIAADIPATKLGLPEVKLGLIPGWGGTQRLPRVVGVRRALTMILKGEPASARQARDWGLVQESVPEYALEHAAREVAEKAAVAGHVPEPPRKRKRGWMEWLTDLTGVGRTIVFAKAREAVLRETRGHYPAATAAITAIEAGCSLGLDRGLEVEAEQISNMAFTPQSRSLRRVFFLTESAKRKARGSEGKIENAGVLGAGTMGAGIAAVLAAGGATVRLRDVTDEALAKGLSRIRKVFEHDLKRKTVDQTEVDHRLQRVLPTTTWTGFGHADIVIEAVLEDMNVKKQAFAELDKVVPANCVLATNTSALDLDVLAESTAHPQRVLGIHFFNPVERMPLVEVVRGRHTSDAAVGKALALVRQLGKVPVVVRNKPGFLVNRILAPYLVEAGRLLLELGEPRKVDQAARDFGMPMGPLELLDIIGLDVGLSVVRTLEAAFGDRFRAPRIFEDMVKLGRLGKKSGKGFYLHDLDEPTADPKVFDLVRSAAEADKTPKPVTEAPLVFRVAAAGADFELPGPIAARLVLPMINEAARVLEEGVCDTSDDVDVAMILGTGFAPFRGGLWHYATHLGLGNVVAQLRAWKTEIGMAYEPSEALLKRAEPAPAPTPAPAEPATTPAPVSAG